MFIYTHNTFMGFSGYLFTYIGLAYLAQVRVDFISASVIDVHVYSFRWWGCMGLYEKADWLAGGL